jgi:tellurite resistance protein TerC
VWFALGGFVLVAAFIDLFVLNRNAHVVSIREAAAYTAVWVSLGLGFTFVLWASQGGQAAGEYLTGFLLEYSLSMDNVFVFAIIFSYFAVPEEYRQKVLMIGILGALVLRVILILVGSALLDRFSWVIYIFGAFLVVTGIRLARHNDGEVHPERNPLLRLIRRTVPMTDEYHGAKFFIRRHGKRIATPLVAVLATVAVTDVIFALDSIPAIFGVTREPFIVFAANAFALLGLRSLYFLLAGAIRRFEYLPLGLSIILVFVGIKMILSGVWHIPTAISLGVIVTVLGASIGYSLYRTRGQGFRPPPPGPPGAPEPDPAVSARS